MIVDLVKIRDLESMVKLCICHVMLEGGGNGSSRG